MFLYTSEISPGYWSSVLQHPYLWYLLQSPGPLLNPLSCRRLDKCSSFLGSGPVFQRHAISSLFRVLALTSDDRESVILCHLPGRLFSLWWPSSCLGGIMIWFRVKFVWELCPVCSPCPIEKERPVLLVLLRWKCSRQAALDVTMISTIQQLMVDGAAWVQDHVQSISETWKCAAHSGVYQAVIIPFIPIIMVSLGGCSDDAVTTIISIGRLQGPRWATFQQIAPHIYSRGCPSAYGGGMQPYGLVVCQPDQPWLMDFCRLFVIICNIIIIVIEIVIVIVIVIITTIIITTTTVITTTTTTTTTIIIIISQWNKTN